MIQKVLTVFYNLQMDQINKIKSPKKVSEENCIYDVRYI